MRPRRAPCRMKFNVVRRLKRQATWKAFYSILVGGSRTVAKLELYLCTPALSDGLPAPYLGRAVVAWNALDTWLPLEARPPLRLREPKFFTARFKLGELSAKRSARIELHKACHSRLPAQRVEISYLSLRPAGYVDLHQVLRLSVLVRIQGRTATRCAVFRTTILTDNSWSERTMVRTTLACLADLPKSKQRAAVTVAAGFFAAREAPGTAPPIATLPFEIIDAFSKIEPDHRVLRAMPLRLRFIPKRT